MERSLRRVANGKDKSESAAVAFDAIALHLNLSPVYFHQSFGQGQAESGALLLPPIGRINLLELEEDARMIFGFDSDARICHGNSEAFARRCQSSRNGHLSTIRRKLDSV